MKIMCPQCQFSREVPEEKLPSAPTMATCPQCQHRFKVSKPQTPAQDTVAEVPQAVITSKKESSEHKAEPTPQREKEPVRKSYADVPLEEQVLVDEPDSEDARFAAFAIDNPWEQANNIGYLTAFSQTVTRVLFAAPRFFAGLHAAASHKLALVFYCIVGALQITFERFWGGILSKALAPMAGDDAQLQMLIQLLNPQSSYGLALLFGTALSVIEIFLSAAVYFVLFRIIVPHKVSFSLLFQVTAYSSVPMLLAIVPGIGSVVGFVWGVACTAVGCRYALRLTWTQTLFGVLPLYLIGLPLLLQFVFIG